MRCAEVPDVGAPAAGEVVFDVLAFPDQSGRHLDLPGHAIASGRRCPPRRAPSASAASPRSAPASSHVKPGDLVINLQRENWAQRRRVKGDDVIAVPAAHRRAARRAMLRINPPTALLLLTDIVDVEARRLGHPERRQLGGRPAGHPPGPGARPQDDERGAARVALRRAEGARRRRLRGRRARPRRAVKARTGGAPIRLGIDAVSGRATARLSSCLGEGGVVCNYGSMTGEDPVMSRGALTAGGQKLVGFVLGRGLATRSLAADPRHLRRPRRAAPRRAPVRAGREGLPDRGDQDGAGPRPAGRAQRQDPGRPERGGSDRREALFLFVATPIDAYNCRRTSVSGSARGGERMAKGKGMRKEKKKPKREEVARMARPLLLSCEAVSKAYGTRSLFDDLSFGLVRRRPGGSRRPQRLRQVHAPEDPRRPRDARPRHPLAPRRHPHRLRAAGSRLSRRAAPSRTSSPAALADVDEDERPGRLAQALGRAGFADGRRGGRHAVGRLAQAAGHRPRAGRRRPTCS